MQKLMSASSQACQKTTLLPTATKTPTPRSGSTSSGSGVSHGGGSSRTVAEGTLYTLKRVCAVQCAIHLFVVNYVATESNNIK